MIEIVTVFRKDILTEENTLLIINLKHLRWQTLKKAI